MSIEMVSEACPEKCARVLIGGREERRKPQVIIEIGFAE
jgi:hypothetical protein